MLCGCDHSKLGIFPKFLSYEAISGNVLYGKAVLMISHVLLYSIVKVNSEGLFIVTSGVFLHTKLSSQGP